MEGANAMLVFAHAGITLGAAALLNGALSKVWTPVKNDKISSGFGAQNSTSRANPFSLTVLGTRFDIRFLIIGALLPDIIDKPFGYLLLGNGRIFCHTLLFLILITLGGYYLYRQYRRTPLFALSFGVFMHLVLDKMWIEPETLFWPLYGFAFVRANDEGWFAKIFKELFTDPGTYIPEIIGIIVLAAFAAMLLRRRKVLAFIKTGRVQ